MPYLFNQTLIFFDHFDQTVQLVGRKANILCLLTSRRLIGAGPDSRNDLQERPAGPPESMLQLS
ncbi:MAG: hypothetical protein IPN53_16385 [Comamonadaceae bacterium]|nr:hypothetical protein [Comamonadaceae bacterium]